MASCLAPPGCGGDGESDGPPRCEGPRRVVFDSVPNGPPLGVDVDGVTITRTCGQVEVARVEGVAELQLVGGCASFVLVDCVADDVHLVFDDTQGDITFSLLASAFGGKPFRSVESSSLSTTTEDGWLAADLGRTEEDPPIARADASGGVSGGTVAIAVAIRELTFDVR